MVTIKAKVHRLPTEDKTEIGVAFNGLHYMTDELHRQHIAQYQHLYITTDEGIKEGDWFINTGSGGHPTPKVYQANSENSKTFKEFGPHPEIRKIIATTDPKIIGKSKITETKNVIRHSIFPSIPQSFIEEYCKVGRIDEVLVEVEKQFDDAPEGAEQPIICMGYEPKLNPDNTIIIHPVEEKMYSRDEVEKLIKRFYYKDLADVVNSDLGNGIDKWIEENL